ncbi:MAG: outer membrane protein transport protein [Bryobacteraceae bacterium]
MECCERPLDGSGGVFIPSSTGVLDALAANPAGLASLSAPTVDLSLSAVFARGSFSNSVNHDAPLQSAPGVMPYGAFGTPIGHSRFSFGLGFLPELTSDADWRYVDAPGVGGATYGLQRQKSAILAASATAGLGIALGRYLALGISEGAVYNSNTYDAPYIFQSQPVLKGLKTLLDLHTTGIGWNTSVGLVASPSRTVRLNVAWKSRTVIDTSGDASGNAAQQFAALGIPFRPDFHYSANIRTILPQSVIAGVLWRVDPRWLLAFQADWIDWKNAFFTLPVELSNGTNADINGLLHSSSLNDSIPLDWKDQVSLHAGFERLLTESVSVRGGFAHGNNPVPGSTLSPLTAAIISNQFSTGAGYRRGRARFDLGYAFDLRGHAGVQQSALLSGEYSNSAVGVGTQTLMLNTSFQF